MWKSFEKNEINDELGLRYDGNMRNKRWQQRHFPRTIFPNLVLAQHDSIPNSHTFESDISD